MVNKNLEKLVREIYLLEQEIKQKNDEYNTKRKILQQYFDSNNLKEVTVNLNENSTSSVNLKVVKVEKVYVDYNVKKLKENLDKEIFDIVVDKQYEITNIKGFINLLKKVGVKPKQIKPFIKVNMQPNKAKIKQLFEIGEITKEQLQNVISSKIIKYITIKPIEGDKN